MDKNKIQNQILEKLEEIVELSKLIYPDGKSISVFWINDGEKDFYHCSNNFYDLPEEYRIEAHRFVYPKEQEQGV